MAVITADTFDALRRYVNVRLQQGVPIVDADWNEKDDIRKFEVRAYLKWFVGDGVPFENDGFAIGLTGSSMSNDFMILSGMPATSTTDPLRNVGRCVVDGMDVIIARDPITHNDLKFSEQKLHASQPGSATLAAALGVPQIAALVTPSADGTIAVYLDVWERLVMPADDSSLNLPGLGTESCARIKREWVVRTNAGTAAPPPATGHSHYVLALVARRSQDPLIGVGDITDRRERRLFMPPATLSEDLFGVSMHDYRRGKGRPAASLRAAINALLHGELPGTPEVAIAPDPADDFGFRSFFFDVSNGLVAVWGSTRATVGRRVFTSRLDLLNIAAGFGPAQQVTSAAAGSHEVPMAAQLPTGNVIVGYAVWPGGGASAPTAIEMKRAPLAGLAAATPQIVAPSSGQTRNLLAITLTGSIVTFFVFGMPGMQALYRRYDHVTDTWLDAGLQPAVVGGGGVFANAVPLHAAADQAGTVWIASQRPNGSIVVVTLSPASGTLGAQVILALGISPFVLPRANGNVLVFWSDGAGIRFRQFANGGWQPPQLVPGTGGVVNAFTAIEHTDGSPRLFWGAGQIFTARADPLVQAWSPPRLVSGGVGGGLPTALRELATDSLWLFWPAVPSGGAANDLFYRRITPQI